MQFEEDEDSEDEPMAASSFKRAVTDADGHSAEATSSAKRIKMGESNGQVAAAPARRNASYKYTQAGSIDFCAMCANKFTITAYTKHTPDGGLCHKCGPKYAGGQGPRTAKGEDLDYAPGPSAVKKRAAPRRKIHHAMHDFQALPTLQSLCINIVSNNIEDVEALMGIGGQNMDSISKSISKNRRLNSQTVHLFLQPNTKRLAFYDCSQLDSGALASIATFCPQVEDINLQLCGMLDNAAIDTWTDKLLNLSRVELYGCFLVRIEAWHRFFETIQKRLVSFKIRETPRFDKGCCEKLVANCPNVTQLGLAQIGPLDGSCLKVLEQYGHQLTYLDVSDPGVSAPGVPAQSLQDEEVVSLLKATGRKLSYLNLSRNADLTSKTLLEGIEENCKSLNTLLLTMCFSEDVQAEHFVQLFNGLKQRGCAALTHVSLQRCFAVNDEVIKALIDFTGKSLVDLNLNSCDSITDEGFQLLAKSCPSLQKIDVGFCRQVTDSFVMDLAANTRPLKEVWLFSCNKIR